MKKIFSAILGLSLSVTLVNAGAVSLSLLPASQTAGTGDTISLDLVIEGLGNFAPDSLGDFDVDILYDTGALTFVDYSLGSLLGDTGLGEAFDFSFGETAPGRVDIAEVSMLLPYELDALQPESFTLATLDFTVDLQAAGSSTLVSIDPYVVVGDGLGAPLSVDGTTDAVISNTAVNVAEPGILGLLSAGLLALFFTGRNGRRRLFGG